MKIPKVPSMPSKLSEAIELLKAATAAMPPPAAAPSAPPPMPDPAPMPAAMPPPGAGAPPAPSPAPSAAAGGVDPQTMMEVLNAVQSILPVLEQMKAKIKDQDGKIEALGGSLQQQIISFNKDHAAMRGELNLLLKLTRESQPPPAAVENPMPAAPAAPVDPAMAMAGMAPPPTA